MRKLKFIFSLMLISFVLSGCITIPTGDGGKIKVSKDGVEIEGEDGKKGKIDLDTKDGGSTITTDDGTKIQMGSDVEISTKVSSEILLPDADKAISFLESSDEEKDQYSITYKLEDSMKDNVQIFKDYLAENNYEVEVVEPFDTAVSLQARKDNVFLMYQFMGEDGEYSLAVIYTVNK
ncbi:hypothetical protein ACXYMX_07390 [Sporosarcina sp. CAU 1771]